MKPLQNGRQTTFCWTCKVQWSWTLGHRLKPVIGIQHLIAMVIGQTAGNCLLVTRTLWRLTLCLAGFEGERAIIVFCRCSWACCCHVPMLFRDHARYAFIEITKSPKTAQFYRSLWQVSPQFVRISLVDIQVQVIIRFFIISTCLLNILVWSKMTFKSTWKLYIYQNTVISQVIEEIVNDSSFVGLIVLLPLLWNWIFPHDFLQIFHSWDHVKSEKWRVGSPMSVRLLSVLWGPTSWKV